VLGKGEFPDASAKLAGQLHVRISNGSVVSTDSYAQSQMARTPFSDAGS
jgi:hypothetical protein